MRNQTSPPSSGPRAQWRSRIPDHTDPVNKLRQAVHFCHRPTLLPPSLRGNRYGHGTRQLCSARPNRKPRRRRIYAICYRFTGSASDAEDLTQDVFLKLYRNLASFDTEKGSFQTWITTLARNLLVDHFRRTRMDRASDSLDASLTSDEDGATLGDRLADQRPTQEAHASGLELKARIQQALAQLSPELREAVVFRDLEDMDYKEIAQVLRIPEGTVKSRISRGRGELARLLQRTEGQVV
jgi:RNA polymerase sigma-70 factor (ECF subfamily)